MSGFEAAPRHGPETPEEKIPRKDWPGPITSAEDFEKVMQVQPELERRFMEVDETDRANWQNLQRQLDEYAPQERIYRGTSIAHALELMGGQTLTLRIQSNKDRQNASYRYQNVAGYGANNMDATEADAGVAMMGFSPEGLTVEKTGKAFRDKLWAQGDAAPHFLADNVAVTGQLKPENVHFIVLRFPARDPDTKPPFNFLYFVPRKANKKSSPSSTKESRAA